MTKELEKNLLKEFCTDVLNHLNGVEHQEWFQRKHGLCENLADWLAYKKQSLYVQGMVPEFLRNEFVENYESALYPFNSTGYERYYREWESNRLYNNQARLGFLQKWSNYNEPV
jgi:hypothetical protein